MSDRSTPDPEEERVPDLEADAASEEPAPPPPEPWTPERVLEWNRYYDLYVVAAALLLIFIGSAHPITNPGLWPQLQAGRLVTSRGPVTTDPFSYTMQGRRWVNVPWLFGWSQAALYDAVAGRGANAAAQAAAPVGLGRPSREQLAAGVLVGLSAVLRVLTGLALLAIRRRGPGLWWVAVCVVLALGGAVMPIPGRDSPILPVLGGIARPAEVASSTWGLLLLAIELVLIHRATALGRPRALIGLVPLFLLWANVDDSFVFGLLFLGAAVVGMVAAPARRSAPYPSAGLALGVLAACAAIVLVNPSFGAVYPAAAAPLTRLLRPATEELTLDQLSFFGRQSQAWLDRQYAPAGIEPGHQVVTGAYRLYIAYYVLLVGAGLASFWLNRRRFSLGRFLVFAVGAVLFGALASLAAEFALVWAAVVGLNGQEWYQDRHGVEGRLGPGWTAWSVGGRAVTLVAIMLLMMKGLTGYGASRAEPAFGFGVNADDFAFEAADYIADARFEGNVLNLTLSSGDALIWRAWPRNPARKTYIDDRPHLFPRSLRTDLRTIRRALYEDDAETWRKMLDDYKITVVMAELLSSDPNVPRVYQRLTASEDWIPFYDDGRVVLFGRADAPATDLAVFRENRLDARRLAFRVDRPIPSSDRTPTPTGYLDRFFPNRGGRRDPQPHVLSAERWLSERLPDPTQTPDLANCLLAIGELRSALARNPDDPTAWRLLCDAYLYLAVREQAVFREAGVTSLPPSYTRFRDQQRAAALNFAIQSTPPPANADARAALAGLHHELGELYLRLNALDLARDQFDEQRKLTRAGEFGEDEQNRLAQLEEEVDRINTALTDLAADPQQPINPFQRAEVALSRGAPGIAIAELDEAEKSGLAQGQARSRLLDLYCMVGQPDKALELIGEAASLEDPSLNTGPGSVAYRQGLVYFLIGSYDLGTVVWRDRAIRDLRLSEVVESLESARGLIFGQVRQASDGIQQLPARVANQAVWEAELGLCLLEAGKPSEAGDHLEKTLELQPDSPLRPLVARYLELLDREVPPRREAEAEPESPAAPAPETPLPGDVFEPGNAEP